MSLNLHKFEDEVKNIVEKSVKEMNMEKVLNGINEAWLDMNFDHEKHPHTGITMLRASEELIETLEENQVRDWLIIRRTRLALVTVLHLITYATNGGSAEGTVYRLCFCFFCRLLVR